MNEYLQIMFDEGDDNGNQTNQSNSNESNETNQQQQNNEEQKTQTRTELLREISAELGINAFDPKEVKQKFQEYEEWKQSQLTEQEKKELELEALRNEKTQWSRTQQTYEAKLEAASLGIAPENLEDALKLAGNEPSKLKEVVEKYPVFLSKQTVQLGLHGGNGDNPSSKTEAQQYMEKKYANSRYYKKN